METLNKEDLKRMESSIRKEINKYILETRERKQWIIKYLGK